ncbi:hypothetical protein R1sor_016817 [Riccia sorocarpa]|uniref:Uncharacterized protein n=1 Tax=Riccia sorocarpa TaxID=122646 RepID=A0ABD3HGJ0_9MARC
MFNTLNVLNVSTVRAADLPPEVLVIEACMSAGAAKLQEKLGGELQKTERVWEERGKSECEKERGLCFSPHLLIPLCQQASYSYPYLNSSSLPLVWILSLKTVPFSQAWMDRTSGFPELIELDISRFFSTLRAANLPPGVPVIAACASAEAAKYGRPIGLDAPLKVDLIIIGAVAVDPSTGARLGKGEVKLNRGGKMINHELERCECSYMCNRVRPDLGYQLISARTKRHHNLMDRRGELASELAVTREKKKYQNQVVPEPSLVDSVRTLHNRSSSQRGESSNSQPSGTVSRTTAWRYAKMNSVMRSFNFPTSDPEPAATDHDVPVTTDDAAPEELHSTGPHGPRYAQLPRYIPTLNEAIYRATWKLQALLDENNASIELQEAVFSSLFSNQSTEHVRLSDGNRDYRSMSLGALLRTAGPEWNGGELGLRGLSSLTAINNSYRAAGMPQITRWRLCTGTEASPHEVSAYGGSLQDDYTSSGMRCSCRTRPKSGLQRDCETCTERCRAATCMLPRQQMQPFDYIPLGSMLTSLCKSRSYCHAMLSMWRARAKWLVPRSPEVELAPSFPIKEWWDGTKAKEISWFWDPNCQFELPIYCSTCMEVYPTIPERCALLEENLNVATCMYDFICRSCGNRVQTKQQFAKGDPRNIPLMAHWDGFQSASTSFRSTWSVETKILSAGADSTLPDMPVLFLPDAKAEGSSKTAVLDACIEPFIRELLQLFVQGVEVDYNYPSELISSNLELQQRCTLRVMLVLFTGDHPAQCKFGGFATGGYGGCRRCWLSTCWVPTPNGGIGGAVLYTENRKQFRYPPRKKTVEEMLQAVEHLSSLQTIASRRQHIQATGVCARSPSWRLWFLYGFNPSVDLTYDAMHVIALSMFKKYTELLKKDVEASRVRRDRFVNALQEVTRKKPRLLHGRWPKDVFTRLGYFKAEEYTNFILYCLPHILHELDYDENSIILQLGRLVYEIGRIFYITTRSDSGWTNELLQRSRKLFASWRIRWEEGLGATASILDHVAGAGELLDDVLRHGPSHRYWQSSEGRESGDSVSVDNKVIRLKSVVVEGTLYRPGDYVFVCPDDMGVVESNWHWKAVITQFFYHHQEGLVDMFFECRWLYNATERIGTTEKVLVDPISDMQLLDPHERIAVGDNCRPVSQLVCHFFPIRRESDNLILALEVGEARKRNGIFDSIGIGHPPPYPEVGDILLAEHCHNCSIRQPEFCVVREVIVQHQNVQARQTSQGMSSRHASGISVNQDADDSTVEEETALPIDISALSQMRVRIVWLRRTIPREWIVGSRRCCRTLELCQLRKLCMNFIPADMTESPCNKWIYTD